MNQCLVMFERVHQFHRAEFNRLAIQPRTPQRDAALRELHARGEQLRRDLARFRETESA
ncbi:MAG: hypothetical protein KGL39_28415 [Patescibacteria group bacterium]|nr:hypothetical protein [Patescibacteria group bacterium]